MRKSLSSLVGLAVLIGGMVTSSGAVSKVAAPQVGFWARDARGYTPAVWAALSKNHGALYMGLTYTTDFGPGAKSSYALPLIRKANQLGVTVKGWILAPVSYGLYANEQNADFMDAAVKAFAVWNRSNALGIHEAVLDLELPAGYQELADAGGGKLHPTIDPAHQCEAIKTYASTVAWAHRNKFQLSGTPVPFEIDDLHNGDMGLADLLDLGPLLKATYDHMYVQAYRSYSDTGLDYTAGYFDDMRRYFGKAGEVSTGDTTQGSPPYNKLGPVIDDVRLLAGLGATAIPIFDLAGTVGAFGAGGVDQILSAAHRPMSRAEIAEARKPTTMTALTRGFFTGLDVAASAASPQANTFGGC